MTDPDTRTVEQTLHVRATPETVWRFWTDPRRMCEWWGAAAQLDQRPGGACRVEMGGGPIMVGEHVELVPHERITIMTLRHTGLPAASAAEHRSGWSHFLPLLAAAAEGAAS